MMAAPPTTNASDVSILNVTLSDDNWPESVATPNGLLT
jgi:hypothetical protein